MKIKKNFGRVVTVLLAALLCTACLKDSTDLPDDFGVGRHPEDEHLSSGSETTGENDSESNSESNSESASESDSESTNPPVVNPNPDGKLWAKIDGKYTYYNTRPDRSALSDLSDVAATSREHFVDAAEGANGSWFAGKVVRDLTTGQVTYVWDRHKPTLDLLDKYNGIYRGDSEKKVCYLTFDCVYEFGCTADILNTLKEKDVPAIFFVTLPYAKTEHELIERMINEGHMVGNHTANHPNLTSLTEQQFIKEIEDVENYLYENFPNIPAVTYMRPPEGATNEWALKLADKMGLRTVLWSFTYKDYDTNNQLNPADALEMLKVGLHNGCVYLLHAQSTTNAAVLGDLIDWIRGQGYEILPLCDIK